MEALGGQIAGVQITQSDGTPGSGFDIKIRGVGTVNGDSSPLYIVDGFEVGDIDYLANSDIESVEVLKDASASAIYGARAANGVVLVTTKSGKEGKPVITYNGSATYRNIPKKLDMLSTYEFAALQVELNPTKYGTTYYQEGNDSDGNPYRHQTLEDYLTDPGIDWQGESFKPTWSQNHDFSISGGTKETKYAASFSHFGENGIFRNSGYKKNSAKLRINQKINKFITFDATINYANTVKEGIGTSGTGGTLNMLSNILRFRPTGGNSVTNEELLNSVFDPLELSENSTYSSINPIKQAEAVKDWRQAELWGANASLSIQLMKNLTFKAAATYNTTNTRRDIFYGAESSQAYRSGGVYGSTQMQKDLRWQSSNTLTYKHKINKKNSFDVMLGHEFAFRSSELLYGQAKDFPFENLGNDNLGIGATPSSVSTSRSDKKLLSFFARGNYNFDNRYLFTATIRADGSTVFSAKNKWGYFPSFSAAWRISEEKFMKNITPISNLKLRLGWGTVGNDQITNKRFPYLTLMNENAGAGWNGNNGVTEKSVGADNLQWEKATKVDIGIEGKLFNEQVDFTVDFFHDTRNSIFQQRTMIPDYVGLAEQPFGNVGSMISYGADGNISFTKNIGKDFSFTLRGNFTYTANMVKKWEEAFQKYIYQEKANKPFDYYYGYIALGLFRDEKDVKFSPDQSSISGREVLPGDIKYKDVNGDGLINIDDMVPLSYKQNYPRLMYGFGGEFRYKKITLGVLFKGTGNVDNYSVDNGSALGSGFLPFASGATGNILKITAKQSNRWTPREISGDPATENPNAMFPRLSYGNDSNNRQNSTFWKTNARYLRLQEINLNYNLSAGKILKGLGVSSLDLQFVASNILVWSPFKYWDPEQAASNGAAYPIPARYAFQMYINF